MKVISFSAKLICGSENYGSQKMSS